LNPTGRPNFGASKLRASWVMSSPLLMILS
jgi:hypothetical protein